MNREPKPMTPLRTLRLALDLSMGDIADMLGVTSCAIGNWEEGKSAPRPRRLPLYAEVLGVTLQELTDAIAETVALFAIRDIIKRDERNAASNEPHPYGWPEPTQEEKEDTLRRELDYRQSRLRRAQHWAGVTSS